jgi:hypothetical protein
MQIGADRARRIMKRQITFKSTESDDLAKDNQTYALDGVKPIGI